MVSQGTLDQQDFAPRATRKCAMDTVLTNVLNKVTLTDNNMSYDQSIQDFINEESKNERGGIQWNPPKLQLNGNEGKFTLGGKNKDGQWENQELPQSSFDGVIVFQTFFSKKKFNATKKGMEFKTREFTSFQDEPIELLEITYGENAKTRVAGNYSDYHSFKEAKTPKDPETGEPMASPYELWAALYVFRPETGNTVKFQVRGSSLSALFDYEKKYQKDLPEAKTKKMVITEFGIKKERNEDAGKDYYSVTFKAKRLCLNDEMKLVVDTHKFIQEWRESWKKKNVLPIASEDVSVEVDELPTIEVEETKRDKSVEDVLVEQGMVSKEQLETNLADIPF